MMYGMYGQKMTKAEEKKYQEDMQGEADLRTLLEAEKIKTDPKRMRCVADKIKAAAKSLENLKAD